MSLEALRVQAERERPRNNDELKQRIMQEMLDASPSVWRNVIMTNSDGVQFNFEVGNLSDLTTGTITTDSVYTSTDTTLWVITTFSELGADQPTAPNPFEEELEALPSTEDSTVDGGFESSSPLRAEDDQGDTMGCEHDPGEVGTAEQWFRNLRGDDEAPEAAPFASPPCSAECPSDVCSPGCRMHVQDNACPDNARALFDCPSCGAPGVGADCGGPPPVPVCPDCGLDNPNGDPPCGALEFTPGQDISDVEMPF